jgi:hypothetical protein
MKKSSAVFYTSPGISVLIIAALLFANGSIADPIYKSTNAQGQVIFSDEPPPNAVNVEQIKVRPAPTEAEHRESVERTKRMETRVNEMGAARRERSQQPSGQVPQIPEVQPTGTHSYSNYDNEQRRRRAIARERYEGGVEHRAPARRAPHAGGGGRGR